MNEETQLLKDLETAAAEMARGAGKILQAQFGRQISIEYKDKNQLDPVTEVDKACQVYLAGEITRLFPTHGILGEEELDPTDGTDGSAGAANPAESTDPAEAADSDDPVPDFLWVLDPLDGTTNYLNGLPVYACSIGVLRRGRLVAGALYIPWPGAGLDGGFVLHCRLGGGCFADGEPVSVYQSDQPVGNRLAGLPGSFSHSMRFGPGIKGHSGEPRTTGSIAYELAMTACGVMQYAIFGAPRMWDMAGGALAVSEAGGTVMARLPSVRRWQPLDSLVPSWEEKAPTMKELRRWVAPLVAGNKQVAPLLAENLKSRFHPVARLKRLVRRALPRRAAPPKKTEAPANENPDPKNQGS